MFEIFRRNCHLGGCGFPCQIDCGRFIGNICFNWRQMSPRWPRHRARRPAVWSTAARATAVWATAARASAARARPAVEPAVEATAVRLNAITVANDAIRLKWNIVIFSFLFLFFFFFFELIVFFFLCFFRFFHDADKKSGEAGQSTVDADRWKQNRSDTSDTQPSQRHNRNVKLERLNRPYLIRQHHWRFICRSLPTTARNYLIFV